MLNISEIRDKIYIGAKLRIYRGSASGRKEKSYMTYSDKPVEGEVIDIYPRFVLVRINCPKGRHYDESFTYADIARGEGVRLA